MKIDKSKWWARDIEAYDRYCRHMSRLKQRGKDSTGMEALCARVAERWPNHKTVFDEIRRQYAI